MLTEFGKLMRIVRINSGDSMKEMAEKLGISLSYLSAIENGKRSIPTDFTKKLETTYPLSDKDKDKIALAIVNSADVVKVNFTELSDKKRELVYELANGDLEEEVLDKIYDIVFGKGE